MRTPAPVTILIMAGATLMDIRRLGAGLLRVGCPSCGAAEIFVADATGVIMPVTFAHERDDCPILLRIEAALDRLQAALGAEAN